MNFQDYKSQIMAFTQLEKDALHVYVGLTVFLVTLWLLKQYSQLSSRVRPWLALFVVFLIAILGEILDYREIINKKHWYYPDNLHDIINTCFWPAVFAILLRWSNLLQCRSA